MSHLSYLAMDTGGKRIAVKSTSGRIMVFDLEGNLLMDAKNQKEGEGSNLLWTPDGTGLIDGSWRGDLTLRSAKTGEVFAHRDVWMVQRIWFDRSGPVVTSQCNPGTSPIPLIAHYDSKTLREMRSGALSPSFYDFQLSPDARFAFYRDRERPNRMIVMSIADRAERELETTHYLNAVGFSPDGTLLLTGAWKDEYRLYRLSDLSELGRWEVRYTSSCAISPDGRWMAMGGWGKGLLVRVPGEGVGDACGRGSVPARAKR